jgi:DHA1 family inner membrane transport protein
MSTRQGTPGDDAGPRRVGLAYLSGGFGLSLSAMLGLLVPLRADEVGIPIAAIGVIVAARAVAEIFVAVPVGTLIARVGPRAGFVYGTAACAAVSAAIAFADGYASLLLLNAAIGAGRSLAWVASQTYISTGGTAEDRARNTGRFSFVSNASQIATPVLVGFTAAAIGYAASFYVVAGYCAAFAVLGVALPALHEPTSTDRVRLRDAGLLFRLPRMRLAMLLTFVRLWVPSIYNPFFALLLVASGYSAGLAGAVISSAAVVATCVNLTTGQLVRRWRAEALCLAGLVIAVSGLALAPHLLGIPYVFVAAAMVGIGNGVTLPLLIVLVSEAAPPGQRGLALGTRNAVNSLSSTLAPLVAAPLVAGVGTASAFAVTGGSAGVLLVVATWMYRRLLRAGDQDSLPR